MNNRCPVYGLLTHYLLYREILFFHKCLIYANNSDKSNAENRHFKNKSSKITQDSSVKQLWLFLADFDGSAKSKTDDLGPSNHLWLAEAVYSVQGLFLLVHLTTFGSSKLQFMGISFPLQYIGPDMAHQRHLLWGFILFVHQTVSSSSNSIFYWSAEAIFHMSKSPFWCLSGPISWVHQDYKGLIKTSVGAPLPINNLAAQTCMHSCRPCTLITCNFMH